MIPTIHSPETKERAFKLYAKGIALAEIARQIGVALSAVRTWSYRGKWKSRCVFEKMNKKGMNTCLDAQTTSVSEVGDNSTTKHDADILSKLGAMPFEEKQAHFREKMAVQALRIPEIIASLSRDELVKNADRLHKLESIARRALNLEEPTPAPVINIGLLSASGELPPRESVSNLSDIPASTEKDLRIKYPPLLQMQ
jgi:transposase-like protein